MNEKMETYFERLPFEINCQILANFSITRLIELYQTPRWKDVIDACPKSLVANRDEAVRIPLDILLAWPWTRNIKYVLTEFPDPPSFYTEEQGWEPLLRALREQPVLVIELEIERTQRPSPRRRQIGSTRSPEYLLELMAYRQPNVAPLPRTKRIVLARSEGEFFRYGVVATVEGRTISVNSFDLGIDPVVMEGEREIFLDRGMVLSNRSYEMFAAVDLGLVDPTRPPGPSNPPLRDRLKMFWTYVSASPWSLYRIMAYLGDISVDRNEEGNWIWAAPFIPGLRMGAGDLTPEDFPSHRDYFRRFGLEPAVFIAAMGFARIGVEDKQGLNEVLGFSGVKNVVDAMAAEVPRTYPGEELSATIGEERRLLRDVLLAYTTTEDIYLSNGERVPNREGGIGSVPPLHHI